jgi:inner membrane protein
MVPARRTFGGFMSDQPSGKPVPSAIPGDVRSSRGPAGKLVWIGAILLLMVIPAFLLGELTREREQRQAGVNAEFGTSWGPPQIVVGPILIIPYRVAPDAPLRYIEIAPSRLDGAATLAPEVRKRGLFHSVVYRADVSLSGTFVIPDDFSSIVPSGDVLWGESFIALRAGDLQNLNAAPSLEWEGRQLAWGECAEGYGINCREGSFLVARLGWAAAPAARAPLRFKADLHLRGTRTFRLAPLGKEVALTLSAPWSAPSFVGAALPERSTVSDSRFEAAWRVASMSPSGRLMWTSQNAFEISSSSAARRAVNDPIGVELREPVPIYQKVERASKYAVLFLALSFLTYFLFETVAGVQIHVVQYGLLGLSVSLFALLLLAFSEPFGFEIGYALSSFLVLAQASVYTGVVTRRPRHALVFGAMLAALFAFLYVLLSLETYSLLLGAVALFVGLSLLMAVTRNVDWSKERAAAHAP